MGDQSELYDAGLAIRKEVVGDEYVQRSLDAATSFNSPLQSLVTEFAWGAVWGREELDRRTRSLINVAMLTAMNRQTELALHVRGALRNGCTVVEIREVLLQSGVYCGFPAALEGFRTAAEAITAAGITLDKEG